jgi:hypothetical protein
MIDFRETVSVSCVDLLVEVFAAETPQTRQVRDPCWWMVQLAFAAAALCVVAVAGAVDVPSPPRGEVDGYLTYRQIDAYMQRLEAAFPQLVRGPVSLGRSTANVNIPAYCLGACTRHVDSAVEPAPALLLTGMHHSREVCVWRVSIPPPPSSSADAVACLWRTCEGAEVMAFMCVIAVLIAGSRWLGDGPGSNCRVMNSR